MPQFYLNATRPLKFSPIIKIEIYCFRGCYVIVNFDANARPRFSVTDSGVDPVGVGSA